MSNVPSMEVIVRTMCGRQQGVFISPNANTNEVLNQLANLQLAQPGSGLLWFRPHGAVRLDVESSLTSQGVQPNDELLVMRPPPPDFCKLPVLNASESMAMKRSIDTQMILERTANVPHSDTATKTGITTVKTAGAGPMSIIPFDVVSNLYTISKTLRQALEDNDDGPAMSPANDDTLDTEDVDPYKDVCPAALQSMTEMGFPEARSKKALVLNGMQVESSMEWLINHEADADIDEPLPPPPKPLKTTTGTTFTPCATSHRTLMTMGFSEVDIVAALQLARNNISVAMDHLLSGDDVHTALAERDKNTMDMNSPIMKEVLKDAHIQARLVEPRVWKALDAFHENPHKGSQFLSDPVIGSIIMFLSQLIKRVENASS
eukprot:m.231066 g.231066  ORF g.231066 m.231066 type:complete len:376 (-) comp33596_c3_seq1:28-1155(-)